MRPLSVIPKQCCALTKKGAQCRKQAILGTATCGVHSRPILKSAARFQSDMPKIGLQAFLEAVLRIGIQAAIERIHKIWMGFPNEPFLFKFYHDNDSALAELRGWYMQLHPELQVIITAELYKSTQAVKARAAGA